MELLQKLTSLHAPSGEEYAVKDFILHYVNENKANWVTEPQVYADEALFQDGLVLVFGQPVTAVYAHMDSTGFTARYENQLIPIGGPEAKAGTILTGKDSIGHIRCQLKPDKEGRLFHDFPRAIDRGTSLVFEHNFKLTRKQVTTTYLDNRLGVYHALRLAETLENGIIAFTCWEEHGGGNVPVINRWIFENYGVRQGIICDVTWATDGVFAGKGTVISMRDRNVPRKRFIEKVIALADLSGANYQLEVEASGSSDGRELQVSPYPVDWVFIGPPGINIHSDRESVYLTDIDDTLVLYRYLMQTL